MIKIMTYLLCLTTIVFSKSLNDYLKIAEKNNPSMMSAYYKYKGHIEHKKASGYLPDPTIGGGYSISPVETRLGPQVGKISIKQSLPWTSLLNDDENIAKYSVNSSFYDYGNIKEKVFHQIRQIYYTLYFKNRDIFFTKKMIENYRSLAKIKEQNNSVSRSSLSSNIMFENKLDMLEEKLLQIENDISYLKFKFNLLLNRDTKEIIDIPDSLVYGASQINTDNSQNLSNNSLLSLDHLIIKKEYEISASKRKFLPMFSIGLDYIFINDREDMIVQDSGKDAFVASLSMNLPINFNRTSSSVEKKVYEKKSLEYKRMSAENILLTDIQRVKFKIDDLQRKLELKERIIARYLKIIAIEEQLLTTDGSSIEKLLELNNDKFATMIAAEKIRSEIATEYSQLTFLLTTEGINHENN
ncbi:MAG: TolC family protein [Candidatus Delongbacteria bacterium]|jgi:cobalt-zinc-cadmium efflux system outer membrane protein|nr:TolC family protein [Candidatus Delongbacteria bacterium]